MKRYLILGLLLLTLGANLLGCTKAEKKVRNVLVPEEVKEAPVKALQSVDNARLSVAKLSLHTIQNALESFFIDNEAYPPSLSLSTLKELKDYLNARNTLANFEGNSLLSYCGKVDSYEVRVRAKDKDHTLLILTPKGIRVEEENEN